MEYQKKFLYPLCYSTPRIEPSVGAVETKKHPAADHSYKTCQADAEIEETVTKKDIIMKRPHPANPAGLQYGPRRPRTSRFATKTLPAPGRTLRS
jgi:hypothetical protein